VYKLVRIISIVVVLAAFTACGGNGNRYDNAPRELNFRSMRDVELDVIISLGDRRARVEELLGESSPCMIPKYPGMPGRISRYYFTNGMAIDFQHGIVISMEARNEYGTERFEIYGYSIGMTQEQLSAAFDTNPEPDVPYFFWNVFDSCGIKIPSSRPLRSDREGLVRNTVALRQPPYSPQIVTLTVR